MFSPSSSPLARYGRGCSQQMGQFSQSSPSPVCTERGMKRREYKPQTTSRSTAGMRTGAGSTSRVGKEGFQRYKLRKEELRKEMMGRVFGGVGRGGGDDDDDGGMSEDGDVDLDDELYRRVMMNEEKRKEYYKRVSFERDFGSSIDPDLYDDLGVLEREFTGKGSKSSPYSPPGGGDIDDSIIVQEYLAELEEEEMEREWEQGCERALEREKATLLGTGIIDVDEEDPAALEREFTTGLLEVGAASEPSPSKSLYEDSVMSSPPSSPVIKYHASPPDVTHTWSCPFCSVQVSCARIACPSCTTRCGLDDAQRAWFDDRSHPASSHVPLAMKNPNIGVVMLCGAPGCDWCFAV